MNAVISILGYPLGWVMWACYQLIHNYAISLLVFTLITRIILVPVAIKQQKSMVKMNIIKPELESLQKKYSKNHAKLNEETMKLYSKIGYSPTSGCLPMMIQMLILFGLIDVIYKPLTHILRLPAEAINAGMAILGTEAKTNMQQLEIIAQVKNGSVDMINAVGAEAVSAIDAFNMNLFGVFDLTQTPTLAFNALIIIPILAGVSSLVMSLVTMRTSTASMEGAGAATMKNMMYIMPVFSTMFTFSVPAGVGIYWFFSNVIGTLQSVMMNKFYNPKEAAEKAKQEFEQQHEQERLERIEAKKKDPQKAVSQKEINRRKLAEARRRDAEKYGEAYKEVDEKDLL